MVHLIDVTSCMTSHLKYLQFRTWSIYRMDSELLAYLPLSIDQLNCVKL